jgi:DNA-binding NarL/FixJ family response regulator
VWDAVGGQALEGVDVSQFNQSLRTRKRTPHLAVTLVRGDGVRPSGRTLICVVDDHRFIRDCISHVLAKRFPGFSVLTFTTPAEIGSDAVCLRQPCCIIYHSHSLCIDDDQVARDLSLLQKVATGVRIVVLSDLEDSENIAGALRHGLDGYIPTSLSVEIASEAIRLVLAGGTFIPASALMVSSRPNPLPARAPANAAGGVARLTPRQMEVLGHLWEGKQNKTIAHELRVSESAVKLHVRHIMKELHANNRTQVALIARRMFGNGEVAETAEITVVGGHDVLSHEPQRGAGTRQTAPRSLVGSERSR